MPEYKREQIDYVKEKTEPPFVEQNWKQWVKYKKSGGDTKIFIKTEIEHS